MFLLATSDAGPVAAALSYRVTEHAKRALKTLHPSTRVLVRPTTGAEVAQLNLDVLTCVQDTEVAPAYRAWIQDGALHVQQHRLTLRGLIRRGLSGGPGHLQAEYHTEEGARALLEHAAHHGHYPFEPYQLLITGMD